MHSSDFPANAAAISVTVLRGGAVGEAARAEVIRAIRVNHGEPLEVSPTEIHARFESAHCRDYAIRAIRAACDQLDFLKSAGNAVTSASVAIELATSAAGDSPEVAQLAEHAPVDAVMISEQAMQAALTQLPETWEVAQPSAVVPEERRILIGPNVSTAPELAAFSFRAVPEAGVFRVERPRRSHDLAAQELFSTPQTKRLGRYQLTTIIGRGATAEVWRAQTDDGETVAIKRLRDSAAGSDQQARRFEREAAVLARLEHPNICGVREARVTGADRYIVMDHIDGATLAEILGTLGEADSQEARLDLQMDLGALVNRAEQRRGSGPVSIDEPPTTAGTLAHAGAHLLPVPQVLAFVRKVAAAVAHAHRQGVLHRDLKPGNILVRPDGEPVVTDFGLAKLTTPSGTSISVADQVLGTLEYMAPEQAVSSREVDERADVYALGAILYELLTGRRTFITSGHLLHDAERLQTHTPIRPREINSQIDPVLELIVLQALRQRPAERYGSVGEFLTDLDHFTRGEPVRAHPPTLIARAGAVAAAIRRRFS